MIALLFFVVVSVFAEDLVPMRWPSAEVASIGVLEGGAINCLLVPEEKWSRDFARAAKGFTVLGVIVPGAPALPRAKRALALGLAGVVLEGDFPATEVAAVRAASKLTVELGLRGKMPLGADAPTIIGTFQGVWAGINPPDEAKAAPSGAPWIDTNAGFLRFVRANTNRPVWVGAQPPAQTVVSLRRYLQMIADAGMVGARWVIDLEAGYFAKLVARDAKTLREFQRIEQVVAFFEKHRSLQQYPAAGQLAIVEDVQNGALLSGSVLDMISVKHTPVRPVPFGAVRPEAFAQVRMAVNVDPQSLDATQQKVLQDFVRRGGTVLTGPAGWRMPEPRPDQVKTDGAEIEKLDQIWKEVNAMTGRRNLGARLFNVSSLLSNFIGPADGSKVVLYLVNYSDFPVDSIAVHLLGKYSRASLYRPEQPPQPLVLYENEDGSGVDLDLLESTAILVAEK